MIHMRSVNRLLSVDDYIVVNGMDMTPCRKFRRAIIPIVRISLIPTHTINPVAI